MINFVINGLLSIILVTLFGNLNISVIFTGKSMIWLLPQLDLLAVMMTN